MAAERPPTEAMAALEALYTAVARNDPARLEEYFNQDHVRADVAATEAYILAHKPGSRNFEWRVDGRDVYPWYYKPRAAESPNQDGFLFSLVSRSGAYDALAWFLAPQRVAFMGNALRHALPSITLHAVLSKNVETLELALTSAGAILDDAAFQSLLAETLVYYGQTADTVQLLIAHGAQVHTVSSRSSSMLYGTPYQVDVMVEEGSFVTGSPDLGREMFYRKPETTRWLLWYGMDWGNDTGEPLLKAAAMGRHGLVELLVRGSYADIDVRDEKGRTPLMLAVCLSTRQLGTTPDDVLFVVEILLKAGADISLRDMEGRTALHHAVEKEHKAAVELLLQHGANPNARTDSGTLVLDLVRRADLELLLRHGADPFLTGENGTSTVDRLNQSKSGRTFMETHAVYFER